MGPSEKGIIFSAEVQRESRQLIELALNEDLGSVDPARQRDITSLAVVPDQAQGAARFVSRASGVVSGLRVCEEVLSVAQRDLTLHLQMADGTTVQPGDVLAEIRGSALDILLVERTCLNFLGRLSGISSLTAAFVAAIGDCSARLFDTRKTTPGWRHLEKYAVACGGGANHRRGLFDAILIKDNHLAMMDRLTDEPLAEIAVAIASARAWIAEHTDSLPEGADTIVQIEVDTQAQLQEALRAHPDIILLDNMSCDQLREAVKLRDSEAPRVLLEASGGVRLDTVGAIAKTGVDRISAGALTHSAINFDIGLDWAVA